MCDCAEWVVIAVCEIRPVIAVTISIARGIRIPQIQPVPPLTICRMTTSLADDGSVPRKSELIAPSHVSSIVFLHSFSDEAAKQQAEESAHEVCVRANEVGDTELRSGAVDLFVESNSPVEATLFVPSHHV